MGCRQELVGYGRCLLEPPNVPQAALGPRRRKKPPRSSPERDGLQGERGSRTDQRCAFPPDEVVVDSAVLPPHDRPKGSRKSTGELSQCHDLSPRRRMPAGVETAGTHRT